MAELTVFFFFGFCTRWWVWFAVIIGTWCIAYMRGGTKESFPVSSCFCRASWALRTIEMYVSNGDLPEGPNGTVLSMIDHRSYDIYFILAENARR